jgi:hypothetical protein
MERLFYFEGDVLGRLQHSSCAWRVIKREGGADGHGLLTGVAGLEFMRDAGKVPHMPIGGGGIG